MQEVLFKFETEVRHIKSEIGVGWVVLDVVCGVVPVLIDALAGAGMP